MGLVTFMENIHLGADLSDNLEYTLTKEYIVNLFVDVFVCS